MARREEVRRGCEQRLALLLDDLRSEFAQTHERFERFASADRPAVGWRLWAYRTVLEILAEEVEDLRARYDQ